MTHPPILAVCGLGAEAKIAAGEGVATLAGGGSRAGLAQALAGREGERFAAVVSFGVAGALDPALRPGDVVVGTGLVGPEGARPVSEALARHWQALLTGQGQRVTAGLFAGSDTPVLLPADKAAIRTRSGAVALDMESHLAAAHAARLGVPFGIVRVVSDAADHVLPPVAGAAMRPDGGIDIPAILIGLLRQPSQVPGLLATARDAAVAFRSLRGVRARLGLRLGVGIGLNLGELGGDVT